MSEVRLLCKCTVRCLGGCTQTKHRTGGWVLVCLSYDVSENDENTFSTFCSTQTRCSIPPIMTRTMNDAIYSRYIHTYVSEPTDDSFLPCFIRLPNQACAASTTNEINSCTVVQLYCRSKDERMKNNQRRTNLLQSDAEHLHTACTQRKEQHTHSLVSVGGLDLHGRILRSFYLSWRTIVTSSFAFLLTHHRCLRLVL